MNDKHLSFYSKVKRLLSRLSVVHMVGFTLWLALAISLCQLATVVRVFHNSLFKSKLSQIRRTISFHAASQIKALKFRPLGAIVTSI